MKTLIALTLLALGASAMEDDQEDPVVSIIIIVTPHGPIIIPCAP